jgi:hypothetical protein
MAGGGTFSARLRKIGALFAVGCAGVPALLAASVANAAPSATAAPRCATCSTTSCSAAEKASNAGREPGARARPDRLLSHASAANTGVPGSDTAVIYSNFPTQDKHEDRPVEEGSSRARTTRSPRISAPTARCGHGDARQLRFDAVKAGVLIISTHGADLRTSGFNGLARQRVHEPSRPQLRHGTSTRRIPPIGTGCSRSSISSTITAASPSTASGSPRRESSSSSETARTGRSRPACLRRRVLVSNHLAAAFGSTAYFGYTQPATDPEVLRRSRPAPRSARRHTGQGHRPRQPSAWAAGGFTNTAINQLQYHAQPATKSVALSPDVSEHQVPGWPGLLPSRAAGPFKIEFERRHGHERGPLVTFLSAKGATLSTSEWTSSSELTLFLKKAQLRDVCPVTVTIAAKDRGLGREVPQLARRQPRPGRRASGRVPERGQRGHPISRSRAGTSRPLLTRSLNAPACTRSPSGRRATSGLSGSQGSGTSCVPLGTLTEHWDGKSWTIVPSDSPAGPERTTWKVRRHRRPERLLGGRIHRGPTRRRRNTAGRALDRLRTWTTESASSSLGWYSSQRDSVSAANPKDIWAVGYGSPKQSGAFGPIVMHLNGADWTESSPNGGNDGGSTELLSVDAISPHEHLGGRLYLPTARQLEVRAVMLHSTGGAFTEVGPRRHDLWYHIHRARLDLGRLVGGRLVSRLHERPRRRRRRHPSARRALRRDHLERSVPSGLADWRSSLNAVTATSRRQQRLGRGDTRTRAPNGQALIHWDGTKWSRVVSPPVPFKAALVYGLASSKSGYAVGVGAVDGDSGFIEAFTPATSAAPKFSELRP